MESFNKALEKAVAPYLICAGAIEGGPLYDYAVCGVVEDLLYKYMDNGELSGSFNYCDFECDGHVVQGCMTVTIFESHFVPVVHTILYERELR